MFNVCFSYNTQSVQKPWSGDYQIVSKTKLWIFFWLKMTHDHFQSLTWIEVLIKVLTIWLSCFSTTSDSGVNILPSAKEPIWNYFLLNPWLFNISLELKCCEEHVSNSMTPEWKRAGSSKEINLISQANDALIDIVIHHQPLRPYQR